LPRGFVDTWRLANQLAKVALESKDTHIDPRQLPETTRFISDTRYLIGAVVAPRGQALFRWQEEDGSREQAATQWSAQGGSALQPLFTGCALEPLLPDAYHAACRNADQGLRLYSLRAAAAFLQTVLNVKPQQLRAVVAPFHEERLRNTASASPRQCKRGAMAWSGPCSGPRTNRPIASARSRRCWEKPGSAA
jgi:hypothetical protein